MKKMLTARETAVYLRISYWKLLELVRQGKIPYCRLGRKIIFRLETLNSWMESNEKLTEGKEDENLGSFNL